MTFVSHPHSNMPPRKLHHVRESIKAQLSPKDKRDIASLVDEYHKITIGILDRIEKEKKRHTEAMEHVIAEVKEVIPDLNVRVETHYDALCLCRDSLYPDGLCTFVCARNSVARDLTKTEDNVTMAWVFVDCKNEMA